MSALYCEVCKKRMVTQKVLDAHMKLRHADTIEAPTVATEKPKVEETKLEEQPTSAEAAVESPANQAQPTQPTMPVPTDEVVFRSADTRELEVSINNLYFKGKEISVPKEMAISVRRSLEEGGFFLKD